MNVNLTTILLIGITFFIILSIWNAINFIHLRRRTSEVQLNDAKYWELKYKQEFFIAFSTLILGITETITKSVSVKVL